MSKQRLVDENEVKKAILSFLPLDEYEADILKTAIDSVPLVKAIPIVLYEQVKSERDIAIEQLKVLNIELFEKPYLKAIPIEWVEKYIEDNTCLIVNPKYKDTEFTEEPVDYRVKNSPTQIEVMLETWRKEEWQKNNGKDDENEL